MKNISQFNQEQQFKINISESRLKRSLEIIDTLKPGVLLDIGCSDGDWAALWQNRGWKSFGIEISPEAVKAACSKGVEAQVCDVSTSGLPYNDKAFDLVFAGEVIEHLVDTDGFLQEISRCLKPGGYLLLTTPNLASFENRLRILFGRYPMWVDYSLRGSGHVRAYTPRALRQQLEANGFNVVKQSGNWVPFLPQSLTDDVKAPWLAITGSLLPNLATNIIVLATKSF